MSESTVIATDAAARPTPSLAGVEPLPPGGVAHIVNHMGPGGIETLVLDLARRAPQQTAILSLEESRESLLAHWPALAPFADRLFGFERQDGRSLRLPLKIARLLRQLRPEAVVTHHTTPLVYGGAAARLAGVKRLAHVEHDAWHFDEHPGDAKLMRRLQRVLRPSLVAVSHPIADRLRTVLSGASVSVIPPGVDMALFTPGDRGAARAALGAPDDVTLVAAAGRLETVKGHDVLIDAMASLPETVHCAIFGEGDEEASLQARIAAAGLEPRVRLYGQRDDLPRLLPAFDLFCLPSRQEGLPRAILEAQACGVPVVASEVGAVRSAVHPASGVLTPPEDAAQLAAAIEYRLSQPTDREAVRAFVLSRFSAEATHRQFKAVVEGA